MKRKIIFTWSRNENMGELGNNINDNLNKIADKNPKIVSSSTSVYLWPRPSYLHAAYIEIDVEEENK